MPWIGCELWAARSPRMARSAASSWIAGGDDESIFQPEWSPDRALYFRLGPCPGPRSTAAGGTCFESRGDVMAESASDRAGLSAGRGVRAGAVAVPYVHLCFCCAAASLSAAISHTGVHRLSLVDLDFAAGERHPDDYQDISSVARIGGFVYFRGGSPTEPPAIVELDLGSAAPLSCSSRPHRMSTPIAAICPSPEPVTFDTDNGQQAYGLFYPPRNTDFCRPGRRTAAADRALPRRPDRRRLTDAQLGHAILDEPRLCRSRRQLRRQHRLWPRVSSSSARQLGDRRRRRLRQRRALSRTKADRSIRSAGRSAEPAQAATRPLPC